MLHILQLELHSFGAIETFMKNAAEGLVAAPGRCGELGSAPSCPEASWLHLAGWRWNPEALADGGPE